MLFRSAPALTYTLNATSQLSGSKVPYYQDYVVTGSLTINGATSYCDGQLGMILDTGAFTTIYDTSQRIPDSLVSGGQVAPGASLAISGDPIASGSPCLAVPTPFTPPMKIRCSTGSTMNQS